jgi:hypothetical protein
MQETDISGMTFTVTAGTGGGTRFQMSEDEWYPAVLTKIEKYETPSQQYGPSLNWTFELQAADFTYTNEGVTKKSTVRGSTSLIFSSNPARPSKLYTWYCKLTGKIPAEGEKVTLGNLLGMKVAVMVKGTAGKDKQGNPTTWYNVEKVKPLGGVSEAVAAAPKANVAVAPKAQPAAKAVQTPVNHNPDGVTDPSQISSDLVSSGQDLYKDVF